MIPSDGVEGGKKLDEDDPGRKPGGRSPLELDGERHRDYKNGEEDDPHPSREPHFIGQRGAAGGDGTDPGKGKKGSDPVKDGGNSLLSWGGSILHAVTSGLGATYTGFKHMFKTFGTGTMGDTGSSVNEPLAAGVDIQDGKFVINHLSGSDGTSPEQSKHLLKSMVTVHTTIVTGAVETGVATGYSLVDWFINFFIGDTVTGPAEEGVKKAIDQTKQE